MTDTQQQPTDQFDPVDPLESEDQVTADEEVGDFAHVLTAEEEVKEEADLVKAIDAVIEPLEDVEVPEVVPGGAVPVKKAPSYMVPRELIDSTLNYDDLFDKDLL